MSAVIIQFQEAMRLSTLSVLVIGEGAVFTWAARFPKDVTSLSVRWWFLLHEEAWTHSFYVDSYILWPYYRALVLEFVKFLLQLG